MTLMMSKTKEICKGTKELRCANAIVGLLRTA